MNTLQHANYDYNSAADDPPHLEYCAALVVADRLQMCQLQLQTGCGCPSFLIHFWRCGCPRPAADVLDQQRMSQTGCGCLAPQAGAILIFTQDMEFAIRCVMLSHSIIELALGDQWHILQPSHGVCARCGPSASAAVLVNSLFFYFGVFVFFFERYLVPPPTPQHPFFSQNKFAFLLNHFSIPLLFQGGSRWGTP